MKKLALALVFGVLSIGAVSAQTTDKLKVKNNGKDVKAKQEMKGDQGRRHEAKSPEERADREAKRLTQELGLTDDQTRQVRELSLRKTQQMAAMKERSGENREAMKGEMQQIRNAFQTDLKNVLTAEQFQKFEALKAEQKAKMKGKEGDYKNNGRQKGEYKSKS